MSSSPNQSAALVAALSVMSGRVDVCDLPTHQKEALGIDFDPKNSIALNSEALMLIEDFVYCMIMGE